MRTRKLTLKLGAAALTMAWLSLAMNQAFAAEYWLKAAPTTVDMPDPNGGPVIQVPMWGYAQCADATFGDGTGGVCGPTTVPGPALRVPAGDNALTVHLKNGLTVPTSLVINGMLKPMTPVWDSGASGPRPSLAARVRSFDVEAAANGGMADYAWTNVKPGTYLYQSGTQVQVQVQMGLYGATIKNAIDPVPAMLPLVATPGQAYAGVGYAFDNEATLLYSEIDPVIHAAVAGGTYGTTGAVTSTINYAPKYFLINGKPYPTGSQVIEPVGSPGTTLLRLLNAGLTTHVPMINGRFWDLVAEDGKPYPYRRNQYTALLPAAKTLDVLFTPEIGATYAIMDRRLSLSNAGQPNGGMMAFLRFGSLTSMAGSGTAGGNSAPVAVDDNFDAVLGVTFNIPAPGVLSNDSDVDVGQLVKAVAANGATSAGGKYLLNANGSLTYTPPAAGASGLIDTFTYQATDGKALSNTATVRITLATPVAPVPTVLDSFDRTAANNLGGFWSQAATTGSPPDLRISGNAAIAAALNTGGQAIWNQAIFGAAQYAAFNAVGSMENSALILKATGGTPIAPANLVRVRYETTPAGGAIVVATLMGGSGVDVYVKQASFPTAVSTGALSAVVDAKGLVTVFQNSTFVGGVQLPDVGAWKGEGRIGIQLQTINATIDDFSGGSL